MLSLRGRGDEEEENAAFFAWGQKTKISLYQDALTSHFWIGKAVLEPRVIPQLGEVGDGAGASRPEI